MSGTRINWRVKNIVRVAALFIERAAIGVEDVCAALPEMSPATAEFHLGTGCIDRYWDWDRPGGKYTLLPKGQRVIDRYTALFAQRWGVAASLLSTAEERKRIRYGTSSLRI